MLDNFLSNRYPLSMKALALWLVVFTLLTPCASFSFSYKTNYVNVDETDQSAFDNFDQFRWSLSAYDDNYLIWDFDTVIVSAAVFRILSTTDREVYLDVNTDSGISCAYVDTISTNTESFTITRPPVSYTNFYFAMAGTTVVSHINLDFYGNYANNRSNASVFTWSYAASNPVVSYLQGETTAYIATGLYHYVPEYGAYTQSWAGYSNGTVYITNRYIPEYTASSNLIAGNRLETGSVFWVASDNVRYEQASGITNYGAACQTNGNDYSYIYAPSVGFTVTAGAPYQLKSYVYLARMPSNIPAYSTNVRHTIIFAGTTNTMNTIGELSTNVTAVNDIGEMYIYFNWKVPSAEYSNAHLGVQQYDDLNRGPSIARITTNLSMTTASTEPIYYASSNRIVNRWPGYNRTNNYSVVTSDFWRVTAFIDRTNLPYVSPYLGELLSYETTYTNSPTRSVAKGKVQVTYSLYQETNNASWTNPTLGATIGPPVHTLTPYSGWPFLERGGSNDVAIWAASPASDNVDLNDNNITNVNNVYAERYYIGNTNIVDRFVDAGGDTMSGVLNMGANSITNSGDIFVGNTTIKSDKLYWDSIPRIEYDSKYLITPTANEAPWALFPEPTNIAMMEAASITPWGMACKQFAPSNAVVYTTDDAATNYLPKTGGAMSGTLVVNSSVRIKTDLQVSNNVAFGNSHSLAGLWTGIIGGFDNTINGLASIIAGGHENYCDNNNGFIGGGDYHDCGGDNSAIIGGRLNHTEGDYSFAAGYYAMATSAGSFVWGDGSLYTNKCSFEPNTFSVYASGGTYFLFGPIYGNGLGISNIQASGIAAGGILPALDGSGLTNLSLGATGIVAGATDTFDLTTRTLTWNTNKSAKGEAFSVGILADLSNDVSSAWASSTNNYYVPLAEAYTNIGGTVTVQKAWGLAREITMTNAFAFNHAFSTNESCVVELQIHGGGAFEPSWDTNYFSSTTTNLTINTNDWNTLMLHKVRAKPTIDVFRLVVE